MSKQTTLRPSWQLKEYERPLFLAAYFGFLPIEAPRITEKDVEATRDCNSNPHFDAAERAALLRVYAENNLSDLPHPLAVAYKKHARHSLSHSDYSLHLIGFAGGIAEAILVRSALSILLEEGHKNLVVDINCIGDKESISTYERELNSYVKKIGSNLSTDLKRKLKEDVFHIFSVTGAERETITESIPSSVAFLSPASRSYFKEVLEYMEALGVEFRLAPDLMGDKNNCSPTIFAIKDAEEGSKTLAVGYRYSRLGKRMGFKKEVPLAGVTLYCDVQKATAPKVYKELPKPKFYVVQLGREAKMKTLNIIEMLRAHRIPVYHFLGKDKIAVQLGNAENLRVPYLIIIGHKEALDDTATIRNMTTRAQDTIPVNSLPEYLKNILL